LVCSPWDLLVNRPPFSRHQTLFAKELAASLASDGFRLAPLEALIQARRHFVQPEIVGIDRLGGWKIGTRSIAADQPSPFEIHQIRVEVEGREVSSWDQPILSSASDGDVDLVCGRKYGVLHFLFSVQTEPGLANGAELGPSRVAHPGEQSLSSGFAARSGAEVVAEYKQSDEGGRFFEDISTYRLVDIGEIPEDLNQGIWLTLKQIRKKLDEGGSFTNEARSALSLVLSWL
jgi:oxidase EvaA